MSFATNPMNRFRRNFASSLAFGARGHLLKTKKGPESLSAMTFRRDFRLFREKYTRFMSQNWQGYVRSKNCNFASFREIEFRFFIARWVPHERSAELKTKRVEICKEMLEVLEGFTRWQKNHAIMGHKCWIFWHNYHCGQCTADHEAVYPRIHTSVSSEKVMFRFISLAQILFLLKYFPQENDSVLPYLLSQFL
jgi:hypothetical protein